MVGETRWCPLVLSRLTLATTPTSHFSSDVPANSALLTDAFHSALCAASGTEKRER